MYYASVLFYFGNTIFCVPGSIFFEKNQFGLPQLVHNGHKFYVNRRSANRTFWVCSKYKALKCRARCVTLNNSGYFSTGKSLHNHSLNV